MFNRLDKGMWWDKSWKLVEGCTPVSPGCAHCWSASETHMRANHPNGIIAAHNEGLTTARHFNGTIRLRRDNLDLPIRTKKPTAFALWNDLFHDSVPDGFRLSAWDRMAEAKQHIFFILTKRIEIAAEFIDQIGAFNFGVLPNVWLYATACNQEEADRIIPVLLRINAAVRGVCLEPLLGPVDLTKIGGDRFGWGRIDALRGIRYIRANQTEGGCEWETEKRNGINSAILGGESGREAQPMHPDWVRRVRDDCAEAAVPFFFKQWGEWAPATREYGVYGSVMPETGEKYTWIGWNGKTQNPSAKGLVDPVMAIARVGKKKAGRLLDGREWNELPEVK